MCPPASGFDYSNDTEVCCPAGSTEFCGEECCDEATRCFYDYLTDEPACCALFLDRVQVVGVRVRPSLLGLGSGWFGAR